MASVTRRSWLTLLGMAPLAGAATAWGAEGQPARTWKKLSGRDIIRRRIPNVEVITHHGKKLRFYDDLIRGKKVLINFMYAQCQGICVPVTENLLQVKKRLGDRVGRNIFFYSITLKPDEDSPEALAHYAEMHGTGDGWLFLTGNPMNMEALRVRLGFTDPDPIVDADKTSHIGNVLMGNEPMISWCAGPGMRDPQSIYLAILWNLDGKSRYELENPLVTASLARSASKGEQ